MSERISKALARRRDGEEGFTLIELLVVVIIIGILAAIAIPVYLNMRQGAWRSSVESDVNNAALSIETLTTQNDGTVPAGVGRTFDNTAGSTSTFGLKSDGSAVAATDTPVATITVSDGNKLVVVVTGNTYTIEGSNTNLGTAKIVYSSGAGGLGNWQ